MKKAASLHFGLPFLLETADVDEAVLLCIREGLQFVELNSNFPQCTSGRLSRLPLKQMAEDHGIFFTLHLDDRFDPFDFNPLVREAYTRTMLDAITLCAKAGMPVINMHIPRGNIVTLPSGRRYLYHEFPEAFREAVLAFRERCILALNGSKVTIAMENSDGWEPWELDAIQMLLEAPDFGLCLDIGHDHAAGNRDLPFFRTQSRRLIHMHAHDGWDKTNHQALGTGEIPLQERLEFARETGATVVLETKTGSALRQSVQYLKDKGWIE